MIKKLILGTGTILTLTVSGLTSSVIAKVEGDKAYTRTDVQALHFFPGDSETTLTLWGTYKTDMARVNGEWKISRHELIARGVKKS